MNLPTWTLFSIGLLSSVSLADNNPSSEKTLEETLVIGNHKGNFTVITEDAQKLVDMPGALGDPLSAVFSLPGVVASDGEGGEPAVRGSSPNDNMYIVDFLPSGYVFHEFSNSVFSEFILQDFELHSAGFGPEYSNVTGATFDIRLRKPKNQKLSAIVDLSLLRSGIFTEGRVTENSAFYLSARKSLIHLVIPENEEEDGIRITAAPQDEDYQFKYAWDINNNNTLTLSANGAKDYAEASFSREADFVRSNPDFEGDAKLKTAYDGQSLSYEFNDNHGTRLILAVGHNDSASRVNWGNAYFNDVGNNTNTVKSALSLPLHPKFSLTVGGQLQNNNYVIEYDQVLFTCTEFDPDCSLTRRERLADKLEIDIQDRMAYFNSTWTPWEKLAIDIGAQWHENDYNEERFSHPRLALTYQLEKNITVTTKYGEYDRLPELEYIFPKIGNPELASPTADHTTFGIAQTLANGWSWNIEFYHKNLDNLALALGEDEPDAELLYVNAVEGKAQGIDVLINKDKVDRWYGWLAVSYGKSERTNLRTSQTKRYFLDTPIIANWVMNYQISDDWDIGWRWHIRSGNAYTPITGVQENPYFEDAVLPVYGDPFSERLPTYNRLDLRAKRSFKVWDKDAELIIDIINVLNLRNVTERSLDYEKVTSVDDPLETEDSASIGMVPTIGFRLYL